MHLGSARTCCVGGRTVAQLVADHAGEVATERRLGHIQRGPVCGDGPHGVGDGHSLVEPAEARFGAPGLATDQRGVGHVDAHRDVVHRLCGDRGETRR